MLIRALEALDGLHMDTEMCECGYWQFCSFNDPDDDHPNDDHPNDIIDGSCKNCRENHFDYSSEGEEIVESDSSDEELVTTDDDIDNDTDSSDYSNEYDDSLCNSNKIFAHSVKKPSKALPLVSARESLGSASLALRPIGATF